MWEFSSRDNSLRWRWSKQSSLLMILFTSNALTFLFRLQNAYYNGWMCSHYCSNILTFALDGTIIHKILNAPGSWHDSNIAERLYQKLIHNTPLGYHIISDTAFPWCTNWLNYQIVAPMKNGDGVLANPCEYSKLKSRFIFPIEAAIACSWPWFLSRSHWTHCATPSGAMPICPHQSNTVCLPGSWTGMQHSGSLFPLDAFPWNWTIL